MKQRARDAATADSPIELKTNQISCLATAGSGLQRKPTENPKNKDEKLPEIKPQSEPQERRPGWTANTEIVSWVYTVQVHWEYNSRWKKRKY